MGRPRASRNSNYDDRRRELLKILQAYLAEPGHTHASLRELAAAAGVTPPTLRHYFTNRDGIIQTIMAEYGSLGQPHLAITATPAGALRTSLRNMLAYFLRGFDEGKLGDIFVMGLTEGLRHPLHGPQFIQAILEPLLQAVESRLTGHLERGDMKPACIRTAALQLVAPVVLGALHQQTLGGDRERPLDLQTLAMKVVDDFCDLYETQPHTDHE